MKQFIRILFVLSLILMSTGVASAQQPPPPARAAGGMNEWVAQLREIECTTHTTRSRGNYEIASIGERLCRWNMSIVQTDRYDVSPGTWLGITTTFVAPAYQAAPNALVITEPILMATVNGIRQVHKLPIMALGLQEYQVQIPGSLAPGIYDVSFRHVLIQRMQNGDCGLRTWPDP
jgi:hypothetical protein